MAIFIPPRGSDSSLSSVVLLDGELVYNTTKKKFYTGNGETSGGVPVFEERDLSSYATKTDIASLLSGELDPIFINASGTFATKTYVDEKISSSIPTKLSDLENDESYAKTDDIPVVTSFISKEDADEKYAEKSEVPSIAGLASESYVDEAVAAASSVFALIDQIPEVSGYATKAELEEYAKVEDIPDVTGFITETDADYKYANREAVETDYATKAEVQDVEKALEDYATKDWIESLDFVSESQLANYATNAKVNEVSSYVDENFMEKTSEVYISLPASGYVSGANGYEPSGDFGDRMHDVTTVRGDSFINEKNKQHSVVTRLSNYSLEIIGESTVQNADGNISTSELDDIPALNELSYKLCTVNIGSKNIVSGLAAFVTGKGSEAIGHYSFAHGYGAKANGAGSHAEGRAKTSSSYSHAEGQGSETKASYSHAEGYEAKTNGSHSHAEGGMYTLTYAVNEYPSGKYWPTTETNAKHSHAEGTATTVGAYSHAEGLVSTTSGIFSHAEGYFAKAVGDFSHSEGSLTKTNAKWSHAEGLRTTANAEHSHAEGENAKTNGTISHAEGYGSITYGRGSHAEGDSTQTSGDFSHAEGQGTIAIEDYQHVEGRLNIPLTGYQHIIGGGSINNGSAVRKNIQTLDWAGNEVNAGTVTAADFILSGDTETIREKINGILARLAELESKVQ